MFRIYSTHYNYSDHYKNAPVMQGHAIIAISAEQGYAGLYRYIGNDPIMRQCSVINTCGAGLVGIQVIGAYCIVSNYGGVVGLCNDCLTHSNNLANSLATKELIKNQAFCGHNSE